uniref:Uncharacterized protein n=1 Tax=Aureoumbra lagunensis TaxID=44058 RepID=A0A7S3JT16_9STRA|mmetsp:Transcript_23622/g.28424  ORF Transcript_23622/g.28424 Transcript_23622/m.28424 type:complete len:428 (+) Transcript_23622:83-1366(+)
MMYNQGRGGRGRSQSSGGLPTNYNPNFNANFNSNQQQQQQQQYYQPQRQTVWRGPPRPTEQFQEQGIPPARNSNTYHGNFGEGNNFGGSGSLGMYHRRPETSSREQLHEPYEQQEYGRISQSYSGGGRMGESPFKNQSYQGQDEEEKKKVSSGPVQQPTVALGDPIATAAAAAAMLRGDTAAGAQFVESQGLQLMSRWMPGFASFWSKLRSYFAVSHRYTLSKLRALLIPWTKKAWRRERLASNMPTSPPGENAAGRPVSGEPIRYALPVDDDNAPDLYIPLVAFLTFALVSGYVKGTSGKFTPQVLAQIVSNCALFQVFELALYSIGLYASGATIPLLDIAVHTGYKYVALCVNLLFGLVFGLRAYYCSLAYTALAASYYMLKTMAQTVPTKRDPRAVGPKREVVVLLLGAIQGMSIWFLGYNREL